MFVPHRKHAYGPSQPVTETAMLFYIVMMFKPHSKHTFGPSQTVTGIAILFYIHVMFIPHRKRTVGLHGLLQGQLYYFICRRYSYLAGNSYGPSQPVNGESHTFLYYDDVQTS
jgi:hypothetical protein